MNKVRVQAILEKEMDTSEVQVRSHFSDISQVHVSDVRGYGRPIDDDRLEQL